MQISDLTVNEKGKREEEQEDEGHLILPQEGKRVDFDERQTSGGGNWRRGEYEKRERRVMRETVEVEWRGTVRDKCHHQGKKAVHSQKREEVRLDGETKVVGQVVGWRVLRP